jgi:glycerophosphoryl diester phosphodiesterase
MLLIAHRGFSQGKDENTLVALHGAAADRRIGGVELDIRLSVDRSEVVLRHDPFTGAADEPASLSLDEALLFARKQAWEVLLECKEYDADLYRRVQDLVTKHAMADRVVLFGFRDIAEKFAWAEARPFRFGIIEEYPWRIPKTVAAYRPDVLLMGWMSPATKLAVQSWWSVFSLARVARRVPDMALVMGVARSQADVEWLKRRNALFAATIDLER